MFTGVSQVQVSAQLHSVRRGIPKSPVITGGRVFTQLAPVLRSSGRTFVGATWRGAWYDGPMTNIAWWKSWKFGVAMAITLLLFATILTLAILGKVTVEAQQIFDFAEWVVALLVGGHTTQAVGASVAGAIERRGGTE